MRKYGICLLLGLCLLLTACGAGQETPDGDAVPAAYWTGGDADLPRLRAETIHCSEAGFYLEDGGADRSPLVTETFSGTLPDGEQELTVDFLWCVFRGEVYVRQPEDARVVVEPIRGCTTAVTVLVPGQDRMEHGRYALARLGENTLEWLFPGQLQGLELRQLELTPDLTRAVFLARVETAFTRRLTSATGSSWWTWPGAAPGRRPGAPWASAGMGTISCCSFPTAGPRTRRPGRMCTCTTAAGGSRPSVTRLCMCRPGRRTASSSITEAAMPPVWWTDGSAWWICAAGRWRTPASRPRRTIPFISRTASW